MPYNIIFFRDERELGNTPWDGSLTSAKLHAKDYLLIHKATRVEVRNDETGDLLFHHPRTIKPAQ